MDPVSWIVVGGVIVLAIVAVVLWKRFGRGSALDRRMGGDVDQGVHDARRETARTRDMDGPNAGGPI
ncbi:hypothetical protein [Agromyces mariniharenae]|uniref:Uncharacterized protein n=1 Tax=Agromyces mariniharenae TaxID=2604423 RepID=A0A5S4UXZ5_9MICO|nr:hypothetical protein [Agromyces mariniharenae]TYL50579.1 hypothetical protein FYC51_15460 [Agromyces mariniharenae]